MSWFRSAEQSIEDVNVLIARKDFQRASEILRTRLQKDPQSVFVRQQLAEVFIASGDKKIGIGILEELASDFARDGFAAKSIALIKKIERIDPGRPSNEQLLAQAIHAKETDEARRLRMRSRTSSGASFPQRWTPPVVQPAPPPVTKEEEPAPEDKPVSWHDRVTAGAMRELQMKSVTPEPAPSEPAHSEPSASDPEPSFVPKTVTTPLFQSFSPDELVSIIRSLSLRTFEPGDIIVSEGEEGDSVFIITSGVVKAFVRASKGTQRKVREMNDGDFFGEISLLKGGPRSATITAATACDLLELDRHEVGKLAELHPNILTTLEEFSKLRQASDAESNARSG